MFHSRTWEKRLPIVSTDASRMIPDAEARLDIKNLAGYGTVRIGIWACAPKRVCLHGSAEGPRKIQLVRRDTGSDFRVCWNISGCWAACFDQIVSLEIRRSKLGLGCRSKGVRAPLLFFKRMASFGCSRRSGLTYFGTPLIRSKELDAAHEGLETLASIGHSRNLLPSFSPICFDCPSFCPMYSDCPSFSPIYSDCPLYSELFFCTRTAARAGPAAGGGSARAR